MTDAVWWYAMIIILTIAYGVFVAINAFITKKQITLSVIDCVYFGITSIWSAGEGSINGWWITVIIHILVSIWIVILDRVLEKNRGCSKTNDEK